LRPERPGLRPENLDLRSERPNLRLERPDLRPERLNLRPERQDLRPERQDLRPERPDLRPERPDLMPERPDKRPERPNLRPKRLDLRPERPDLSPERPRGAGRTDERTNERTKVPLCSTGHRPLRGRCPATHHLQSPTYTAGQRVSLTTYCPWATGSMHVLLCASHDVWLTACLILLFNLSHCVSFLVFLCL